MYNRKYVSTSANGIIVLGSLRNDDGNGNDNAINRSFDWLNEEN